VVYVSLTIVKRSYAVVEADASLGTHSDQVVEEEAASFMIATTLHVQEGDANSFLSGIL